ncbi:OLC1v1007380C1 [Oldenlandia corymbosa var. corymbosa]|uniref:OLC1v1007380C1 n=1 Tax=Oldenlandia corymbosa var. corymbosa TaxID=529605 RepID=A0AAV1DJQ4_OLDCO|nr:OLC1v1007380C1 [Oldenlandia corymbosa var. corymbosa]
MEKLGNESLRLWMKLNRATVKLFFSLMIFKGRLVLITMDNMLRGMRPTFWYLFIDDFQRPVGSDHYGQHAPRDAANILVPCLARGELQTIKILTGLKKEFEDHHKVSYSDDALIAAAKLSKLYIRRQSKMYGNITNGEKKLHSGSVDEPIDGIGSSDKVVSCEMIKQVISSRTRIPVEKVSVDDSIWVLHMENILREHIVGQDKALRTVARVVRRSRVGLRNLGRPIASFIFRGPTGVGKTQLAKLLAREYFGSNKESMIRLDMSEYTERCSVSRLLGLFQDGMGQVVDFRNTIIIMTSTKDLYLNNVELKRIFSLEFLYMVDEIVEFKWLGKNELVKIVDIMLKEVCETIVDKKNVTIEISMRLKEKLISDGCNYCGDYGARPLKRAITVYLEDKLAKSILNGNVKEGNFVAVDVDSKGNVLLSSKSKNIGKQS